MLRSLTVLPTGRRCISLLSRVWSGEAGNPKFTEKQLSDKLRERFPKATDIQVTDVSGGCGAMYEITVEAGDFRGLSMIKQHRLVTETLKTQIKEMHGLRITTLVPDASNGS